MKKTSLSTWLVALVCVALVGKTTRCLALADDLSQRFQSPPAAAKPWVYWFWLNGNITREGITADLEAMARAGIGGTLIMHVGAGIPAGPVKFFSPEWRSLFQFAVAEAKRLGLEVGMNACDGWTGTGGPWIKPEESMMRLVWSEIRVAGPGQTPLNLPQPPARLGVYHDVAVLAFPLPPAEAVDDAGATTITSSTRLRALGNLADGNRQTAIAFPFAGKPLWVQFEFAQAEPVRGCRFVGRSAASLPAEATIQISDDGRRFRTLRTATFGWHSNEPSTTVSFDETRSRFFRIVFTSAPRAGNVVLTELELLRGGRINYWEPKAGFARRWGHGGAPEFFAARQAFAPADMAVASKDPDWAAANAPVAIDPAAIQVLTAKMHPSGRLDWQVPEGEWMIVRLGYAPTGELNGPASVEGTGLEPDALAAEGVSKAFSRFLAQLLKDVGPLAGDTLRYGHIDSWETGEQNWTGAFAEEFRRRRGYDLIPWLPVMAGGRIVGSLQDSERFLWDVRRTIADLLGDNYYRQMREACHAAGIRFEAEASGAQQFLYDPIVYQREGDLPMGEFWLGADGPRVDCKVAASVAHLYDKPFVGAESFTSGPTHARWQEHPFSLKPLGDEALAMGVNRFVFHRYAMQPWLYLKPGMTMGPWGIHFERTNTWWEPGAAWLRYLARCQSMLQTGRFVADVLCFTGEDVPNYLGKRDELNPPLPPGYDYDGCDAEVLVKATVEQGRIVTANGMSYRVLLLPNTTAMTPPLIARIGELVDQGATVIGPRPDRSPSLEGQPASDARVRRIAADVWGKCDGHSVCENNYGKGRVYWGVSFPEVFRRLDNRPDFEILGGEKATLHYIHRRDGDSDWYFVASPATYPVEATCLFRVEGRQPELWNAENGQITLAPVWQATDDRRTAVTLRFEPAGSTFVVFRRPPDKAEHAVSLAVDGSGPASHAPAIEVLKATYGPPIGEDRTVDVTEAVRAKVARGERSILVLPEELGVADPARMVKKVLRVELSVGGYQQTVSAADRQTLVLAGATAAATPAAELRCEAGASQLHVYQPGRYTVTMASGQRHTREVSALADPLEIGGPWQVSFPPGLGAPESTTLAKLESWSEHDNDGIKYFSGTATYAKEFQAPAATADTRLILDLGRVEVMAEPILNGRSLGVLWKPPFRVDIGPWLKPGKNRLEVRVTNLWPNRLMGDARLPADVSWAANGALASWPAWAQGQHRRPGPRVAFSTWNHWQTDGAQLLPSGLLGPVQIKTAKVVELSSSN